jgi:hypothetical protein
MTRFSSPLAASGGNGAKAFLCMDCRAMVSSSDRLAAVGGATRHQFTNPAGMDCDFLSFLSCPGAVAQGAATEEYSWFSEYRWRIAFCRYCGHHLGWNYQSSAAETRPKEFWGILLAHILVV